MIRNNKEVRASLIQFSKIGDQGIGYISVAEQQKDVPFDIKRVYWTYATPEEIVRGRHAHKEIHQVLVAVHGRIVVNLESLDGKLEVFELNDPKVGLYIPPMIWHTMQYSEGAVQMVLSSELFNEEDYIRDYQVFKNGSHS